MSKSKAMCLDRAMVKSAAFLSLSGTAIKVLMLFLTKRKMVKRKIGKKAVWEIGNNGEITFSYQEAEKMGIRRDAFRRALQELSEKGFIDRTQVGNGGMARVPSLYWIDDRWEVFDEQSKKAVQPPKKPFQKDDSKGRGWSVHHAKKIEFKRRSKAKSIG